MHLTAALKRTFARGRIERVRPCPAQKGCLEFSIRTDDERLWHWCLRGPQAGPAPAEGPIALLQVGHKPGLWELDAEQRPAREVALGHALELAGSSAEILVEQTLIEEGPQ